MLAIERGYVGGNLARIGVQQFGLAILGECALSIGAIHQQHAMAARAARPKADANLGKIHPPLSIQVPSKLVRAPLARHAVHRQRAAVSGEHQGIGIHVRAKRLAGAGDPTSASGRAARRGSPARRPPPARPRRERPDRPPRDAAPATRSATTPGRRNPSRCRGQSSNSRDPPAARDKSVRRCGRRRRPSTNARPH